jgi:hypothetical protein
MSDEDIEKMKTEMEKESKEGIGGPVMPTPGQQPDISEEQYPPEDNTAENGSAESLTPMLDAEVEKYSSILNKR